MMIETTCKHHHFTYISTYYFREAGCFQGLGSDSEIKGGQKAKEKAEYFKKILQNSVDVSRLTDFEN
jgi:hypothetical protein